MRFLFLLLATIACRNTPPADVVFITSADKISFSYVPGGCRLADVVGITTKFAMNGAMYAAGNYKPVGLYIQERKLVHKAIILNNPSVNSGINPQAVFFIDTNNRAGMIRVQQRNEKAYRYAVQIAPMLLENGIINPVLAGFKGKTVRRNGMGVTAGGKVVFILATRAITLAEFAGLFSSRVVPQRPMWMVLFPIFGHRRQTTTTGLVLL
jgi:uncharacterized protein YigE (DUF2233 family)